MAKKKVIAIGIDPCFLNYSALPQFTPELFRRHIDDELDRLCASGYEVTRCLIDLGDTAEASTVAALKAATFDCVVIGAGLRQPGERLLLFEKIINLVHRFAPTARICFNTKPADTLEAVQRWIKP
ncbi:MAG: hypothetical protein JO283_15455 [Bradyrhizobium sp.]|nr:hypothetical protein [Bradyrhizobium sp.]